MAFSRGSASGLLIVNADDWGLDSPTTDATLDCFRAGAITSASGMVWMADSARAAAIARTEDLPIDLHLNLIEPFTASDAPREVAERQRRVASRYSAAGARGLLYHPQWAREVERCIADQMREFERLYGRAPAHVDGHRHGHLALNCVFARPLGRVPRYRPAFTFLAGESSVPKRVARALLNGLIRTRFRTARYLFNLRALHPALGGSHMDEKLSLADRYPVEVMVHPGADDELRVLGDGDWVARISRHRLGSYAQL